MDNSLIDLASQRAKISSKLREGCIDYLKTILASNNNIISWEVSELPEYVSVSYDGGNHPEYASNVYSTVNSVKWDTKIGEVVLDTEDSYNYPLDSVTTTELYDLCDFIDTYKEKIGWKYR